MSDTPIKLTLYPYNVYFGDCILLIFDYAGGQKRSVLIDFGSSGKGKKAKAGVDETDEANQDSMGARLLKVAEHVSETCGQSLDVVVATHRHKDHIHGFGLAKAGKIIKDCHPKLVVQPWTENPDDHTDMSQPPLPANGKQLAANPHMFFHSMLRNMHEVAASAEAEMLRVAHRPMSAKSVERRLREKLLFTADNNKIKNKPAVDNLHAMGLPPAESHYVYYDYQDIDWEKFLPGVTVRVLGPPRLEDNPGMTSTAKKSPEYWIQQALNQQFWGIHAVSSSAAPGVGGTPPLFEDQYVMPPNDRPANVRWVIRQLRSVRTSQLLELVQIVDSALNNTSVILLFEVGDQKLLFPGDAQIENWSYALKKAKKDQTLKAQLEDITVYKVGHHGSRNANPRSLWEGFKKKSTEKATKGRLKTVVSTIKGKHGESIDTEVPLAKMVTEMTNLSEFHSTENYGTELVVPIEIKINS